MTRKEQLQFVKTVLNCVDKDLTDKLEKEKLPIHWQGMELMQYITDRTIAHIVLGMNKSRKKDYDNDVLINGL